MTNLLESGDLPALRSELETYDRTAKELRQLHFMWHVPLFRAGQAILYGRFDEAERLAQDHGSVTQTTAGRQGVASRPAARARWAWQDGAVAP